MDCQSFSVKKVLEMSKLKFWLEKEE